MAKRKNQYPELSPEAAEAIIAQVFEKCGQEPNQTPLSVLTSYSLYRRDRFSLQKVIIAMALCVFLLLPAVFIAPRYAVEEVSRSTTGIPTFRVTVTNWLPVRLVSANVDGHPVPVYESESEVYTVEPTINGTLTITVTLANRQYSVWSTQISGIDAKAPTLVSSENRGGVIRIYYEDAGVGCDGKDSYAVGSQQITPLDYNNDECWVEFPLNESMNVFIPDRNGNVLQLLITLK